jgi:hypothetical protein
MSFYYQPSTLSYTQTHCRSHFSSLHFLIRLTGLLLKPNQISSQAHRGLVTCTHIFVRSSFLPANLTAGANNRRETPQQQGPKQEERGQQQQRYPVTTGEGTPATAGDLSTSRGHKQQRGRQKRQKLDIKTQTSARTSSTAGLIAKGTFRQCRRVPSSYL